MALNNPINSADLLREWGTFVSDVANSGIVWGTNNKPFSEMPTSTFGGTTSGPSVSITGDNIGQIETVIQAEPIVNSLIAETRLFTNVKNLRARLEIIGNVGGITFDQTRKAHMNTSYRTSPSINNTNIFTGQRITDAGLTQFFTNCRTAYTNARDNATTITIQICHASCHSSCHSSRGRR